MFHHTRLKLTAWYLLIIMTVSISFSAVIYRAFTIEADRFGRLQRFRIEQRRMRQDIMYPFDDPAAPMMLDPIDDPDLLTNLHRRILTVLFMINGSIFILSGALGYMLAGRTLQPIADMVEEQNRFISDASHELRTPLTALKSTIEVYLRDKHLTLADAKLALKESIEEVDTLQSLSNSLLTLAQYRESNPSSLYSTVSLPSIVSAAVKRVKPLAIKKHITIHTKLAEAEVMADEAGITDVLVILLDNAIKYSREKSTITIGIKKTSRKTQLTVKDEGIGISKEDMPHVFDRFYRADSARTKKNPHLPAGRQDGYGLGLAIAKKIIETHRATIHVESEPEKGSTFTITWT